ncbi:MAG: hypothetical protein IJS08_05065, partial [Victivallales bacterium]|nr:hypothetical protein [Victivallales bacterium]
MKTCRITFLLAVLLSGILLAETTIISRRATGTGRSYRAALDAALIMAMEKNCGMTIQASQRAILNESEVSISNSKLGDEDKLHISDMVQADMKKWCGGTIAGYEVLSDRYDETTHQYTVELEVQMDGRYIVGDDPNILRRMVVSKFDSNTSSISFMGANLSTSKWIEGLESRLNDHITQTRKFTMLDRKYDDAVNKELDRSKDSNASLTDFRPRQKQKLATDYLVVGKVNFRNVGQLQVDPHTKMPLPNQNLTIAEVNYRVLLAATGQLKWSNTITVSAWSAYEQKDKPISTVDDIVSFTAENAATQISDEILSSILPFIVVAVTPNDTIVIGEGGKSISVGERLEVYKLYP